MKIVWKQSLGGMNLQKNDPFTVGKRSGMLQCQRIGDFLPHHTLGRFCDLISFFRIFNILCIKNFNFEDFLLLTGGN